MYLPPKIPVCLSAAVLFYGILFCSFLFCSVSSAQTPADTAFQQGVMEAYQRGAEAERSGDFVLAESVYLDLLKRAKDNNAVSFQATANHRLAVLKAREYKYSESEKYFREALPFCENNVSFLCDYAKIYFDQKRFSAAEPFLKSAALASPNDRRVLYNLGCTIASQEGRQTEGLRYLKLSLGEKEAYRELAKIYRQQGKENEALFALQRAEQITANQPIPQITEDIQEQLKKELSFYESKRAVAQLNREAQRKEESEKKPEERRTEQKDKIKVLPSADSNAADSTVPNRTEAGKSVVKMFPPAAPSVRLLPAEENEKISIIRQINNETMPLLRHLEVIPPAVVQLIPPQNPEDLPRAQLKTVNPPYVSMPDTTPESSQGKASNDAVNNTNTLPDNIVPDNTPQVRYEFARIEPQKNAAAKPEEEPVLAFRPKNDDSVNSESNVPQYDSAPVAVQNAPVLENPFRKVFVQENPVQEIFVRENPVRTIPVQKETAGIEIKPETKSETKPSSEPALQQPEPQMKFIANWRDPEIPPYLSVNPPAAEKINSGIIDIAAVPVERKPPVFERPVIETPQQETTQIAWASPVIPAEEMTSDKITSQQITPQEVTLEPAKELTVRELGRKSAKEPTEKPDEEIVSVMPNFALPKPVLPKIAQHPAVGKPAANETIAAVPAPVSKPSVSEPPVPKPSVSELSISEPPTPKPPLPLVQNIKRTPSIGMMSDAEFGDTLQHIQRIQEQQEQTVEDEAPAGFARTNKNTLTADTETAVSITDSGFARSSSFAQLPPSSGQNQIVPVQTTQQDTSVIEYPPVYQQEFRPLLFKNSLPPQQKRRW